ncbi:hypothetical protein ACH5RR_037273 [Cinchona calisaya]|uniref:Uncharacterized protein n=1 Tax=Cinchona calisaya TaxID=153742 RepID=A0ABD2Y9C0_9GENT
MFGVVRRAITQNTLVLLYNIFYQKQMFSGQSIQASQLIEAFRHQTERLVNELKKSAEYAEEKLESIEERGEQLLQISKHIHDSLTVVDLRTQQLAEASKDVENHVNVVLNYSKAVHEQSMAIAGGVNGRYAAAGPPCR